MIGYAPMLLAGAAAGAGSAMVLAAVIPRPPDLQAALDRLANTSTAAEPAAAVGGPRLGRALEPLTSWLVDVAGLRRFRADLLLLDDTLSGLAARKVGYGMLGFAFPPTLAAVMALLGLRLPVVLPGFVAVGLAVVLFWIPELDLRRRAEQARGDLRRAVAVYVELVALERAADAGAIEALARAAAIADGAPFHLIRDALLRAELDGSPPWEGLAWLAARTGVSELDDVADIMRLSGRDGAAVYATLRARAMSLRAQLQAAQAATANAASERMVMPVAFLGLAFMALLGYPAVARILFGP